MGLTVADHGDRVRPRRPQKRKAGPAAGPDGRRARATREAARRPGVAVRLEAARRVGAILAERSLGLDEALAAPLPADDDGRDAALVRALVRATVRRLGDIDAILSRLMDRPLPAKAAAARDLLRIGAAQILFLRTRDFAAVDATVEAFKASAGTGGFAGLANAVLRRLAREREALLESLAPASNTPPWLFERWVAAYGPQTARLIAESHRREPPLDLTPRDDAAAVAAATGGRVLPTGSVRLAVSGPVEPLPGFAAGAFWVQDAAAALPARLLGDVAGLRVADVCAAPGGKTLQLAAAGAEVTAIDVAPDRLARVEANLARTGLAATLVAAEARDYAPAGPFDAILLDAPCTATGTIRRHPDIQWLKTARDLDRLAALQAELAAAAAGWLAPGGRLLVCTCSLEQEEGEALAARIAADRPELVADPIAPDEIAGLAPFVTPAGFLRTIPGGPPEPEDGLFDLDGFFAARFVRRS